MPIPDPGYIFIDLPPISPEILASYDQVPIDPYMAHQTRYKRFSQYRLTLDPDDGWQFSMLPHRAYSAFKKFNPVAGGILREYLPIEVDFQPIIKTVVDGPLPLDESVDWQINVHQNRSVTTLDNVAPLTPEGIHQDGHEYVMISILRRENVRGGETRLWRSPDAAEPIWRGTMQPGQAVLLDDRAVWHDVTEIVPDVGEVGRRDILIVSFSRWQERWYGEEHEAAVLAGDAPASSM